MTAPRQQWFHFGPWVFSVHDAMAIIAAAPRPTQALDVPTWAQAFGLTRLDDPHTISLIGPTPDGLDRDYAMSTDLTQPLIVAQLLIDGLEPSALLIDGTHRLYRAWREDVPQLPAYVLTPAESRDIQKRLLLGPGRTWLVPPA